MDKKERRFLRNILKESRENSLDKEILSYFINFYNRKKKKRNNNDNHRNRISRKKIDFCCMSSWNFLNIYATRN